MKHFIAYGEPRTGRDRNPTWIPERYLYEVIIFFKSRRRGRKEKKKIIRIQLFSFSFYLLSTLFHHFKQ